MKISLDLKSLNPGQKKFLQSTSPNVLLTGGFGSGKTLGLGLKALQLKSANPGVPGLLISQTYGSLWGTTVRRLQALLKCLPPKQRPKIKDKMGECYLDFGDGVPLFLRSARNPESYDGLDVGFLLGDEIRHWSKKAYDIAIGRRRVKCPYPQSAFSSTPELHWMADEFNTGKPNREIIRAPTRENLHNLADDFEENLRLSYSPKMQLAVLEGRFTVMEGAVFEDFEPHDRDGKDSPWIVDWQPSAEDLRRCKVSLAVDPGFRRSAYIFIIERGPMDWVVFDQIMPDNKTDTQAVEMVNRKGYPIDEIWVDPAGDNTQSFDGRNSITALREVKCRSPRPIHTNTAFRSIAFGVDKVRVMLGGYEGGKIMLRFTKKLQQGEYQKPRGIVRDLEGLRYPELIHGKRVPNMDKPLKDNLTDHSTDALRYWCVGQWLSNPELRKLDQKLAKHKGSGYNVL